MANFLDELDGDFVKWLRANTAIATLVGSGTNARIYPGMARHGVAKPHVIYTQASGEALKTHQGRGDGCREMVLHVYSIADSFNQANQLAMAIEALMNPLVDTGVDRIVGDGTKIIVCNGGIVDDGVEPAINSSDTKKFWVRLVLRMVIKQP